MFSRDTLLYSLGLTVVCLPVLQVLLLGIPTLVGRPLSEHAIRRVVQTCIGAGLLGSLTILGMMLASSAEPHVALRLGSWVAIPNYHFSIKFVFDRLSVPFLILSYTLCGTIGAFACRYMHREPGFNRFFVFYVLFVLGMVITSLAGTIETLFAGWELVGLSSALLVAFYHERPAPSRNGLRVWGVYRISDAALLIASVVLHHATGEGDFDRLVGDGVWPAGTALMDPPHALMVGLLLLVAAAAKSALVPFSGWLPRAMEGPTPSSAVFYGALSVHLGAFLLLRVSPLLDLSLTLRIVVVFLGVVTAIFAAFAGRVQTDIKSALSFASLAQVGIIVAEIGCGLRYVALAHILGHGCLRTLQFVRAPSLLYDYRSMENAIGSRLPQLAGDWPKVMPARLESWFYRFAMDRGYLDSLLDDYLVSPFLRTFRWCDALERRWSRFLSGSSNDNSGAIDPVPMAAQALEDLP